jgi:Flp pilus assembly pilin Flp
MKKITLILIGFILSLTTMQAQTWTQIGSDITGEGPTDGSGYSVSLSSDGNIVAIGAPGNDDNGELAGHVRVFQNISGIWEQIGEDIDGETAFDLSGRSVCLSSNGNIVAIGASQGGTWTTPPSGPGYVRIFQNFEGIWTQIGNNINGEALGDRSGCSVSLSSDGNIVAIGAKGNDDQGSYSGHVRVYQNISGTWTQIGKDIDGESAGDDSGFFVSLSSSGNIVAVGAIHNDGTGNDAGHVRVYENISGTWHRLEKILMVKLPVIGLVFQLV